MVDPKPRKDGRCAVCKKPRPVVKPQRGVPPQLYVDSFCSSSCCRAYHNQPNLDAAALARKAANPPGIAPKGGFKHGTRGGYRLCACDLCTAAVQNP